MKVRPAGPADRAAWDAFVANRAEGDPLQCWAWGDVVGPTGERPRRLLLVDGHENVRGLALALVRPTAFGRSVAYVPHGPLWEREAPDAAALLALLVDGLRMMARGERTIVVKLDPRALEAAPDLAPILRAAGLRPARHDLQARTTRIVDLLDGGEALTASWHADARRLSRRAAREGVAVRVHREAAGAALDEFHALLALTARRGDFRARSRDFLGRLAEAYAPARPGTPGGGWYLALARLGERAIAGMAVPRVADRAYYLYGASLRDPALKHAYGPYAAMAALMRTLAADGVRTLDLWGVTERDDPAAEPAWAGFSAFKRTFGGQPLRHPGTFDLVVEPAWHRLRDLRERLRGRPA